MNDDLTIKTSGIGGALFLLLYPLDSLMTSLGQYLGLNFPVGLIGIGIAYLSLAFIVQERYSVTRWLVLCGALMALMMVLVWMSPRSGMGDYYLWSRAFAFIYAGVLMSKWVINKGAVGIGKEYWLLFTALVIIVSFIGREDLNYLRLSEGIVLTAMLILGMSRTRVEIVAVILMSVVTLYVLGTRFSFIGFILAVLLFLFLRAGRTVRFAQIVALPFIGGGLYHGGMMIFNSLSSVHDNRLLRLLYASEFDTSATARALMLEESYRVFFSNPWTGSYKYYRDYWREGSYAHNYMSLWSEFGLVGVAFSTVVIIVGLYALRVSFAKIVLGDRAAAFVFMCTVYLMLGFIFAKSYHWSSLYIILGIAIGYIASNRQGAVHNEHHIPSSTST